MKRVKVVILAVFVAICMFSLSCGYYAGNGYVYDSWPILGVTKRKLNRPVSKVIRVFW